MTYKLSLFAFCAIFLLAISTLTCSGFADETYKYTDSDNNWQKISEASDGQLANDITALKQFVSDGNIDDLETAIVDFKNKYPAITGEDFDAYMEGEKLFAIGKWQKAVRAYNTFMDEHPESMYFDAAVDRELSVAIAYLAGEKRRVLKILKLSAVDDGAAIIYSLSDRLGDTEISKRAMTTLATGFADRKKYIDSYEVWSEISSRWPTGDLGKESLIQRAYMLHSAYGGNNYDNTGLTSALSFYSDYKSIHPESAVKIDVDKNINYANEQVAYKEFSIGEYYTRVDKPEAAKMYYNYVLEKWPNTGAGKAAKARLQNSEVTVIVERNPNKKFSAPKMFNGMGKKLFEKSNSFVDSWPNFEERVEKYILNEEDVDKPAE